MKNLAILFICTLLCFSSCNRPLEFDATIWNQTDELSISVPKERYRMSLWLVKNFEFANKTPDEINGKLGSNFLNVQFGDSTDVKSYKYLIKQYNPNFIIGIDMLQSSAYLNIEFDNNVVSKVSISKLKNKVDEKWTETIYFPSN